MDPSSPTPPEQVSKASPNVSGASSAPSSPSEQLPAEPPAPEALRNPERWFLRLSVFQAVLALAGLFTGAVALYAALEESQAVRRQASAIVWPYVQVALQTSQGEEAASFEVQLVNAGVGPALIDQVHLQIAGRSVITWRDAVTAVGAPEAAFSHDFAAGRVLRPGEVVRLFSTQDPRASAALLALTEAGQARLELCYCSIYDQCWLRPADPSIVRPQAVASCPTYGERAFQN